MATKQTKAQHIAFRLDDLREVSATVISTRWVHVDDVATRYYLDVASADLRDLALLEEPDGYSHWCAATLAKHYEELPRNAQRAARAELGERARRTDGW